MRQRQQLKNAIANVEGVAAIEFAFVAPLFFLFIFSILEIALVVLYSALLNDAALAVSKYLRDESMKCVRQNTSNCTAATTAGMREAACGSIAMGGMSCSQLKLAIYDADDPVAKPIPPWDLIDDVAMKLQNSRRYIIAVGYEWPFVLPTSRLLLPNMGDRIQLQSRVFSTTAEKALR